MKFKTSHISFLALAIAGSFSLISLKKSDATMDELQRKLNLVGDPEKSFKEKGEPFKKEDESAENLEKKYDIKRHDRQIQVTDIEEGTGVIINLPHKVVTGSSAFLVEDALRSFPRAEIENLKLTSEIDSKDAQYLMIGKDNYETLGNGRLRVSLAGHTAVEFLNWAAQREFSTKKPTDLLREKKNHFKVIGLPEDALKRIETRIAGPDYKKEVEDAKTFHKAFGSGEIRGIWDVLWAGTEIQVPTEKPFRFQDDGGEGPYLVTLQQSVIDEKYHLIFTKDKETAKKLLERSYATGSISAAIVMREKDFRKFPEFWENPFLKQEGWAISMVAKEGPTNENMMKRLKAEEIPFGIAIAFEDADDFKEGQKLMGPTFFPSFSPNQAQVLNIPEKSLNLGVRP